VRSGVRPCRLYGRAGVGTPEPLLLDWGQRRRRSPWRSNGHHVRDFDGDSYISRTRAPVAGRRVLRGTDASLSCWPSGAGSMTRLDVFPALARHDHANHRHTDAEPRCEFTVRMTCSVQRANHHHLIRIKLCAWMCPSGRSHRNPDYQATPSNRPGHAGHRYTAYRSGWRGAMV
jgi:hypothetical protein